MLLQLGKRVAVVGVQQARHAAWLAKQQQQHSWRQFQAQAFWGQSSRRYGAGPLFPVRELHASAGLLTRGLVIDSDGTKLGAMSIEEAKKLARQKGLELKQVHKPKRSRHDDDDVGDDDKGLGVFRIMDVSAERKRKEQVMQALKAFAELVPC